jgi:hypothetical protein
MPIVPPIVTSDRAGSCAYLLAWYELEPGQWGAEIAWMEWDGHDWRGRRAKVVSQAIEKVEGQDYGRVPKRKISEWLHQGQRRP